VGRRQSDTATITATITRGWCDRNAGLLARSNVITLHTSSSTFRARHSAIAQVRGKAAKGDSTIATHTGYMKW
jgi:hypothetical protein